MFSYAVTIFKTVAPVAWISDAMGAIRNIAKNNWAPNGIRPILSDVNDTPGERSGAYSIEVAIGDPASRLTDMDSGPQPKVTAQRGDKLVIDAPSNEQGSAGSLESSRIDAKTTQSALSKPHLVSRCDMVLTSVPSPLDDNSHLSSLGTSGSVMSLSEFTRGRSPKHATTLDSPGPATRYEPSSSGQPGALSNVLPLKSYSATTEDLDMEAADGWTFLVPSTLMLDEVMRSPFDDDVEMEKA
ncbi:hypothetical protein B0J17DRAFT_664815 [Rhizoctonia solani]|nr:hypothetical protein B0J17DRAFT_664815 [Rhizoctonia solani]